MKKLLILLLLLSFNAEAKLCHAQICESSDETKCIDAFLFVANKPTKTLSGTVAKMPVCKPLPKLIEIVDTDKDGCFAVELTFINRFNGLTEKYWYKNGAISSDGVNWDREQNPGCPPL